MTDDRPVLVGSCPSSGSTLLSVILDAHPDVHCGPELTWLSHPCVWRDTPVSRWRKALLSGLDRPDLTGLDRGRDGFCPWVDFIDSQNLPAYGWTHEALCQAGREARGIHDLLERFYAKPLARNGKTRWVDKSPTNLWSIPAFLERFPDGRGVVLVRDGRDVVASLVRRGYAPELAAAIWLLETIRAVDLAHDDRVLLVRYEELVTSTRKVVEELIRHLELSPASSEMLAFSESRRSAEDPTIQVDTWRKTPASPPDATLVGSYRTDLAPSELGVISGVEVVTPPPGLAASAGANFASLLDDLGYETASEPLSPEQGALVFRRLVDDGALLGASASDESWHLRWVGWNVPSCMGLLSPEDVLDLLRPLVSPSDSTPPERREGAARAIQRWLGRQSTPRRASR